MENSVAVQKKASRIKLLLMDCDGVLTDGHIWILENGDDQKAFSVRDGLGLELLHRAGLRSGVISGRSSNALTQRAAKLGMTYVRQDCNDKIAAFDEILADARLTRQEVAYIGDDLTDIPLMLTVELGIAVGDAAPETVARADYVTIATGGKGAVREVVELILKSQGRWNDVIESYFEHS
jgi:3-deoxy-D-manno-octulosonate 8-phosphate phosphatase (KDO 8-P phosphatase)